MPFWLKRSWWVCPPALRFEDENKLSQSKSVTFPKTSGRHVLKLSCPSIALQTLGKLNWHLKSNPDCDAPIVCVKCDNKVFGTPSALKNHMNKHVNFSKAETCPVCFKVFESTATQSGPNNLKHHLRSIHCVRSDISMSSKYNCEGCDQGFDNLRVFRKHQTSCQLVTYPCKKCHITFKNKCWLGRHACSKFDLKMWSSPLSNDKPFLKS